CVDESAAADVDADVAEAVEEDQIARPKQRSRDVTAGPVLVCRDARQRYAQPSIDVRHQARTVEAGRALAAPHVRHTEFAPRECACRPGRRPAARARPETASLRAG